jgi:3-oxoacyl-[acyl-carrier protein] reductase
VATAAEGGRLAGKAALVTGGGTGVGRATALQLARQGCAVAVNYRRSRDEAEQTCVDLEKLGVPALALQADVADDAAVRAMLAAVERAWGRLDVLVNNAATTVFVGHGDLEKLQDEDWDRVFSVNVKGAFQCARAARPLLAASGDGQIVNVSSVAGVAAVGSSLPYCASKAALNNLTVALARALAPEIRVNAVAPGAIQSRWLEQGYGRAYESVLRGAAERSALKKTCTPDDVADAILALLTGSALVTGQIVVCDGGMLIHR